jgi:hypothetical protein
MSWARTRVIISGSSSPAAENSGAAMVIALA